MHKIRYRLVYNYGNRLNRQGLAPVAVECRQGSRKMYISSNVLLTPDQWDKGRVVNHDNADKMTAYLVRWRNSIEEIELDALLNGKGMSLYQLKDAVRTGTRASATIAEFVEAVIIPSANRKKSTKDSYRYIAVSLDEFRKGVTLNDLDHHMIESYRSWMKDKGLSYNTIVGRLKALRCLVNEAIKRNLIDTNDDPFKNITIGEMKPHKEFLSLSDIGKLERVYLEGKEAHIRDAFLFMCFTGLRYSDFCNMRSENLKRNKLTVDQLKTGHIVILPLDRLFGGKPLEILSKYRNIEEFADIGINSTVNRVLKEIERKARINKPLHCHLARKVCGTLLNQYGMKPQEIQYILGHQRLSTTFKHYSFTVQEQVEKSLRRVFKNKL